MLRISGQSYNTPTFCSEDSSNSSGRINGEMYKQAQNLTSDTSNNNVYINTKPNTDTVILRKKRTEKKFPEQPIADDKPNAERQYKQDMSNLSEAKQIIGEMTEESKVGFVRKAGKVAEVTISAALCGMSMHWGAGKTYSILYDFFKKPNVTKFISNVKKPFKIIGSSIVEGTKTTRNAMAEKFKNTKNGKKLAESKWYMRFKKEMQEVKSEFRELKQGINNLSKDEIRGGISTVAGVGGAVTPVVSAIDEGNNAAEAV